MEILVENEIRNLAVGCLHVIYGRASVEFPTSTRAHPSYWVFVGLNFFGPLSDEYRTVFPFRVWWKVWKQVIVPVVKDSWNQNISLPGTLDDKLEILIAELTNRLRLSGMIPDSPSVEIPDNQVNPTQAGFYGNAWWVRLHFKLEDLSE
jgi:hypothetical protein